ncbi:MAG TPA: sigma-70 family RNA polymerase sigma factor [Acetobacteraceae bacterium]|nr:sigma-70 family RNA polymerase sigma factor [Acetobacteraceae bacterium]
MSLLSRLEDSIPSLRRYAWTLLRDPAEADDLVQDCLVRALDRLGTVRSEAELRPWLFAILHNLHVSRWRRQRRQRQVAVADADADVAIPASQPAGVEIRDVLRGIAALPEDQRQIVVLVAVEGLAYAEVAAILGIPVGTVMSRLSRARDRLRAFAEGHERPALRRVK